MLGIGRAPDNDVVVNDVQVSRYHARADKVDGRWRLADLGSRNGTLLNGRPVGEPTALADGDRVTVGTTDLVVRGDTFEAVRTTADRRLVVTDVVHRLPNGKPLLSGIDLDIGPGELVAVVGPSGAGKSTLLKVLTGELTPAEGTVVYDRHDVHHDQAAVRGRIGVVPQEDVLHTRLTAWKALSYAARLRLPDDTGRAERQSVVRAAMAELELTEHAHKRVRNLSGGQRKRVSIALELLTSPPLLLLDEPTSGLDPALDRQVMGVLRSIADAGRTVVVVTHNVTNLGRCDRILLLAPGGVPHFSGTPAELTARFGTEDWADVYDQVSRDARAATRKRRSPVRRVSLPIPPPAPRTFVRHALTVAARHARLVCADVPYAFFLLLLPVALAFLALAVPGTAGLGPPSAAEPAEPGQLLVLLFVGAAFMGGAAAAREVVAERAIFLRERAAGLHPHAYVAAKALVFLVISGVQSALLVGVVLRAKPGPASSVVFGDPAVELGIAVWCTTFAACVFALLCSALVRSGEQVMPVLVITVMAQLVLCGGMIPVTDRAGLEQLSWLAPARWGYAAGASTVDLRSIAPATQPDELWTHAPGWWALSVAVLATSAAFCLLLLRMRLARLR